MGGEWNTGANSGSGNMANAFARQSDCHCAKLVGMGLCRGGGRRGIRFKGDAELAVRIFRRNPARAGDAVDPQERS